MSGPIIRIVEARHYARREVEKGVLTSTARASDL